MAERLGYLWNHSGSVWIKGRWFDMAKRIGSKTLILSSSLHYRLCRCWCKKEKQASGWHILTLLSDDSSFGQKTWERQKRTCRKQQSNWRCKSAILKKIRSIFCFAGDLLNQCISSALCFPRYADPILWSVMVPVRLCPRAYVWPACLSTPDWGSDALPLPPSFLLRRASVPVSAGMGGQRTPTAQWTVTGSGACVVAPSVQAPFIRAVTVGTVQDLGITDINNMEPPWHPPLPKLCVSSFLTPAPDRKIMTWF